jgi:DNA-binding transcriptional ArsR family regulator
MLVSDDACSRVFQALSDRTRLGILELLKKRELCVAEIGRRFDMTQPSISHHLDVLKRAGLVTAEKRGREVYYRFNREALVQCCGTQFRLLDLEIRMKEK